MQQPLTPIYKIKIGEVVSLDHDYRVWKNPLMWIHFISLLWFISWFIVFLILLFGHRSFMNNWAGLLVYFIGTSVIIIFFQILFFLIYLHYNNIENIEPSLENTVNQRRVAENPTSFMSIAHTKELTITVIITLMCSIFSASLWYNWLCFHKNICSYESNSTLTDVNIAFDTPKHIQEFHNYQTTIIFFIVLQLVAINYLIRAMWTHFRPLHSITHLVIGFNNFFDSYKNTYEKIHTN